MDQQQGNDKINTTTSKSGDDLDMQDKMEEICDSVTGECDGNKQKDEKDNNNEFENLSENKENINNNADN